MPEVVLGVGDRALKQLLEIFGRALRGVLYDTHSGCGVLASDEIENDLHLARRYSDILEVCLGFSCFHCFVILPSLKAMRRSVPSHHDGQRRVQF